MKGTVWIGLFHRIPATYHDSLVVKLTSGAEVVLQTLLSLDEDYMVVRGRTAGSTDEGRVFLVPYDQMQYVGFNRYVSEPDLRSMFGSEAAATPPPVVAADPVAEPAPAVSTPEKPPETEPPKKPAAISKTILLARLRARLAQDSKPSERPV
jgi:hypothetical protein